MADNFPPIRLRIALWLYSLLWWVLLPVILLYLWQRGRKDALYFQHLGERWGRYSRHREGSVWVHAVSLGEMRSATPLIRALLAEGETVVTTHFTPTGRREAMRGFAAEVAAGEVIPIWVPFELGFAYRRFFRAFKPKYGLVMEIEIWPRMIMASRAAAVPLFMCNAQYPQKSYEKDKGGLRATLLGGFAGGFVKSETQKKRFAASGMSNLHVTGELRFDQPIPAKQIQAAEALRRQINGGRPTYTLTSVVEGEDATYIEMIKRTPDACFVYVPRAPERFDEVANMLAAAGLDFVRRSEWLDDNLQPNDTRNFEVLLGDSMGEMYFYLGLCDRAIVGGGFHPKGAHNIIEPLALKKPVMVGPHIWTIEYPATEAIAAGVCIQVMTEEELHKAVAEPPPITEAQIDDFYRDHAGGTQRTLAAIKRAL